MRVLVDVFRCEKIRKEGNDEAVRSVHHMCNDNDHESLSHALTQMDQWLTSLFADTSGASTHDKIVNAKPADLVDACFTGNGTVKIVEPQVYSGNTTCNSLFPAFWRNPPSYSSPGTDTDSKASRSRLRTRSSR